jgi:hypothetical protein
MIPLTGLWKGKTNNGEPMMSGNLSYSTRIVILKNKYKKKDNDPDYQIFIAKKEKKDEEKKDDLYGNQDDIL